MRRLAFVAFVATLIAASCRNVPRTDGPVMAKTVALQAVNAFCIAWDLDELDRLTGEDAAYEDRGPGSFKRGISEMRKMEAWGEVSGCVSVREVIFFQNDDVAALRTRCAATPELSAKRDLWAPKALPAHLGDGIGCFVVAKEIHEEKEVDTEVYIFVVKRINGECKIVYFDNS